MSDDSTITVHLTVTAKPGAPRVPLSLKKSATCTELRNATSVTTQIPLDALKLIVRGRLIANDDTKIAVQEFKLEEGSVLHCMGKPSSTPAASTPPATASAAAPVASAAGGATVTTTTPAAPPATPPAASNNIQAALQRLRQSNSPSAFQTAVTTLQKMIANIVKNPMEEKYRRVKKQNAAFMKRLGNIPGGGDAIMTAVGFTVTTHEGEPVYMLEASPQAWPQLLQAQAAVDQAVAQAQAAATVVPPPPMVGMPSGMGASGGMGAGLPVPNDPAMQAMASNLLSNPAALQNMLQNPMVQQMMRNDPRFGPEMQQMMGELANNPQMAEQFGQIMQNPAMRAQMQQAMAAGQQPGAANAFPNFMPPGANAAPAPAFPNFMPPSASQPSNAAGSTNTNSAPPRNDNEQTEEEMIAEAIRRSLQDNN